MICLQYTENTCNMQTMTFFLKKITLFRLIVTTQLCKLIIIQCVMINNMLHFRSFETDSVGLIDKYLLIINEISNCR